MKSASAGLTLIELVVTMALLGVAVMTFIASFGAIQRSVVKTKNRTIATSLCRERMETLKNRRYPLLRPTPQADLDALGYDATHFPPEIGLAIGGSRFDRFSRVDKARLGSSGPIVILPPGAPDAGLKRVMVWAEWDEEGSRRRYEMTSLLDDPNRARPSGAIAGVVYREPGGAGQELAGARVRLEENPARADVSGAAGSYRISTTSGTFRVRASARGYFDRAVVVAAAPNAAQDFVLPPRGVGGVSGRAYLRDHLVVSQVVASTVAPDGFDVQFVELYNPTTSAIFVGDALSHAVRLRYTSPYLAQDCPDVALEYVATTVAPNSSYLIANASSFMLAGAPVTADAFFADAAGAGCAFAPPAWFPPASRRLIEPGQAGAVALLDASGSALDAVGWTLGAASPAVCEGACVFLPAGLPQGEQLVRLSAPGAVPGAPEGRAFDSNQNAADFAAPPAVTGLEAPARATASGPQSTVAGTPAAGAVVSADDDLSAPVVASATGYFHLPGVATCASSGFAATWTVLVSSGARSGEASGVSPPQGGALDLGGIPLVSTSVTALITGTVLSTLGPPAAGVVMASGGSTTLTDGAGFYRLVVAAGSASVTANAGRADPGLASVVSQAYSLAAGQALGGVDFTLDPVGSVSGAVTSNGVDPLAGVLVRAEASGVARGSVSTDGVGRFRILDLPISALAGVGAYAVSPALDTSEVSTPPYASAVVTQGAEVDVGTFTAAAALGLISGSVADSGAPIATGVLVMATQSTIAGAPPNWDETLRGGSTAYYTVHARPDGTFGLPVRVSAAPYNVYAWYSKLTGAVAVTTVKTASQLVDSSSGTFVLSFAWP